MRLEGGVDENTQDTIWHCEQHSHNVAIYTTITWVVENLDFASHLNGVYAGTAEYQI